MPERSSIVAARRQITEEIVRVSTTADRIRDQLIERGGNSWDPREASSSKVLRTLSIMRCSNNKVRKARRSRIPRDTAGWRGKRFGLSLVV